MERGSGLAVKSLAPTSVTSARGRESNLEIVSRKITDLVLDSKNTRVHSLTQLKRIAKSIERFGFVVPVLIDGENLVIAGHGRILAAQRLGWRAIPTICIEHLTPEEVRAFQITDNRLAELATWDRRLLGEAIKGLLEINFDVDVIGFDMAEVDLIVQELDTSADAPDPVDQMPIDSGPAVTQLGDCWKCGPHLVVCADALKEESYKALLGSDRVAMVFTDPPYWVPIKGHVSGKGRIQHGEFVMGSDWSTEAERIEFFRRSLSNIAHHCVEGAILVVAMDFRHDFELQTAARSVGLELKNICCWEKTNAGMGALYRSAHEFFFILKKGKAPHTNNILLGKYGRSRNNVWHYPGMSSFGGRKTEEGNLLALHPTVKPVALVQDVILDVSKRGDLVLDAFGGSGSTQIACEKTGRKARLLELDPRYCDAIVRRWQAYTGGQGRHAVTGQLFDQAATENSSLRRVHHG